MNNMIHWFEIPATDFDRAVAFYQQVFHVELKVEHFMDDRIAVFPDSSGCIMASPRLQPAAQGTRIYLDGSPGVSTLLQPCHTTRRPGAITRNVLAGRQWPDRPVLRQRR